MGNFIVYFVGGLLQLFAGREWRFPETGPPDSQVKTLMLEKTEGRREEGNRG